MITPEEVAEVMVPESEDQIDEFEIINQITMIRAKNNLNWMAILKLAFKYAPEETRAVMSDITNCDMQISGLSKKIAEKNTFGG